MGKFTEWLDENHIVMTAYDKHDNNKKVFTTRAKSDDEVKTHMAAIQRHVQRIGRTYHVLIHNKRTFEHESHTLKANNPLGRKYDS